MDIFSTDLLRTSGSRTDQRNLLFYQQQSLSSHLTPTLHPIPISMALPETKTYGLFKLGILSTSETSSSVQIKRAQCMPGGALVSFLDTAKESHWKAPSPSSGTAGAAHHSLPWGSRWCHRRAAASVRSWTPSEINKGPSAPPSPLTRESHRCHPKDGKGKERSVTCIWNKSKTHKTQKPSIIFN